MRVVPLTFQPWFKTVIWGGQRLKEVYGGSCPEGAVGEAWILSTREGTESLILGGPYGGHRLNDLLDSSPADWLGTEVLAETGREFPLLMKIIDAATDLSMQVHPDAKMARSRGGDVLPKTECWWILDAASDARLYLGLREGASEDALRAAMDSGEIPSLVEACPVEPDDFFFVLAGAVHAIGGGTLLLEVQESSDTTYRLHDWGRVDAEGNPRPLHVEEGLEAARARPRRAGRTEGRPYPDLHYEREIRVECPEFIVERMRFKVPIQGRTTGRRFHLAVVLEGTVRVERQGKTFGPFKPWAPILLPAAPSMYRFVPERGPVTLALVAPGGGPIHESETGRVRLQKVLAGAGVGSRRGCEKLIEEGRVMVDGMTVDRLGTKVNPETQEIRVDGESIQGPESRIYILLNKPKGVVCTNRGDPQGRPRAVDLIHGEQRRIYTIGRLDLDSEGAILLTNDGAFANRISHPRFGIPKVYLVHVQGQVSPEAVDRLQKGIWFSDGKVSGFKVQVRRRLKASTWLRVVLTEGKNREIRRALARVGHPVKSLTRVRIGNLTLKGLRPGQSRRLTPEELKCLDLFSDSGATDLPEDIDDVFLPRIRKHRPRNAPRRSRPGERGPSREKSNRGRGRKASASRPPRRNTTRKQPRQTRRK